MTQISCADQATCLWRHGASLRRITHATYLIPTPPATKTTFLILRRFILGGGQIKLPPGLTSRFAPSETEWCCHKYTAWIFWGARWTANSRIPSFPGDPLAKLGGEVMVKPPAPERPWIWTSNHWPGLNCIKSQSNSNTGAEWTLERLASTFLPSGIVSLMIRTSSLTFSYSCRTTWWILAARGSAAVRSGWDNLLAEAMLESLIGALLLRWR